MTTPFLPLPIFRAFDNAGLPLAGGKLYSFAAGTSTPQATYSDAAGVTPNANPVILDSTGSAVVRLGTLGYKFQLTDSTGGTTFWTEDNYIAMSGDSPTFLGTVTANALVSTTSVTAASVTATGAVTGASIVPSSASVPIDGLYLPSAHTIGFASNSAAHGSYNGSGNWTIPAPTAGTGNALSVTAVAGGVGLAVTGAASASAFMADLQNAAAAGSSQGLRVQAGGNSSDVALIVKDRTGATIFLALYGDGGIVIGAPTGGNKGPGTLNIQGTLYVNGTAVTVP